MAYEGLGRYLMSSMQFFEVLFGYVLVLAKPNTKWFSAYMQLLKISTVYYGLDFSYIKYVNRKLWVNTYRVLGLCKKKTEKHVQVLCLYAGPQKTQECTGVGLCIRT